MKVKLFKASINLYENDVSKTQTARLRAMLFLAYLLAHTCPTEVFQAGITQMNTDKMHFSLLFLTPYMETLF